jgi:MYXO-CTERM domain-containing protein
MAGDLFIGEGNQVMKAGSEAVEVSFLPTLDATRIPAGSVLSYRVELTTPISNAPSAAMRPTIAFKESQLQLPVIADPNATAGVAPSLGDAFLSLTVKGDREEFVNPSEARAFQLTVLNEGAIEDVVTLAAIVDGDGCRAEFKPGDKYRLAPGDSARFGVLVYAPVNPKEGAQCKVHVNATSRVDPSTVASRDLLVTITRGVDTPNDADNYTSNQDAASKLDVERGGKKSPSAPIGPFILLLLAGVWAVRRRSQL